jgi:hypothetical protein
MKIFISHSSNDKWIARQIAKLLEAEGNSTFLDEKDISTGDCIRTEIQKQIGDSDHVLILISPSSLNSHWVFIELGCALALEKKVIPILLHVGTNEIPLAISNLLARDINDLEKYFDELRGTKNDSNKPEGSLKSFSGFNVGDLVQIISVEHLTSEDKLLHPRWVPEMDKFSGIKTRISRISPKGLINLEIEKYIWNVKWLNKIG